MKLYKIIPSLNILKDWRLWLLFIIVNMSGNLFFTLHLPSNFILISVFISLILIIIVKKIQIHEYIPFILFYTLLLLFQVFYLDMYYSFTSQIHFLIKIIVALLTFGICKNRFIQYYSIIIDLFCISSLCCSFYIFFGGEIPYIEVESTSIDDGNVLRASSIIYTQLLGEIEWTWLGTRNCGPFWEPGAFQGFINLSFFLNIVNSTLNKKRLLLYIITLITTFSTGGYIVMLINLFIYFVNITEIRAKTKIIISTILFTVSLYLYNNLEFLGNKISSDSGRLGVSFHDLSDGLYFLFGYGLGEESIARSQIQSVSSIYNMIKYVGVVGFFVYFFQILLNIKSINNYLYLLIIFLILMNEPFISIGPFWWCIPFIPILFKIRGK